MKKEVKELLNNRMAKTDKLVLAVSGGVDSVVLLDLIAQAHPKSNITVAHVNHGMRKEAKGDEKFVMELAEKYGLEFVLGNFNLVGKSEAAARKARYDFLEKVRKKTGSKYILTAHHLDDQAETLILNLARGTGPLNFWGMNNLEGNIFRPLLGIPKVEIENCARQRKLKWVTDSSNNNLKYARNRIRHMIIPELKKINPKFLSAVKSEVELGQMAATELTSVAKNKEKNIKNGKTLDIKELNKQTSFLKELIVFRFLTEALGRADIYRKNVKEVLSIINSSGTKKTSIGTFTIEKNYDKIIFSPKNSPRISETKIEPGKSYKFGRFSLKSTFSAGESSKNNILISPEIAYNLRVRSIRPGDKIKTRAGTKKISDIFTDAKINLSERKSWPIVTAGNEVVWVPLLQASGKALKKSRNKVLIIEVKK